MAPIYEYEHTDAECALGKIFEQRQNIREKPLTACPECGQPVRRLISRTHLGKAAPSDKKLGELGFKKLVRREKGVYEDVTAKKDKDRFVVDK